MMEEYLSYIAPSLGDFYSVSHERQALSAWRPWRLINSAELTRHPDHSIAMQGVQGFRHILARRQDPDYKQFQAARMNRGRRPLFIMIALKARLCVMSTSSALWMAKPLVQNGSLLCPLTMGNVVASRVLSQSKYIFMSAFLLKGSAVCSRDQFTKCLPDPFL